MVLTVEYESKFLLTVATDSSEACEQNKIKNLYKKIELLDATEYIASIIFLEK